MSMLRVTDNSNLLFEIQVPSSLIPNDVGAESVIRINKLKKNKEIENDRLLFAQINSNIMTVAKWYKAA